MMNIYGKINSLNEGLERPFFYENFNPNIFFYDNRIEIPNMKYPNQLDY